MPSIREWLKAGDSILQKVPASLKKPKLSGKDLGKAYIEDAKIAADYAPSKWRETELLPSLAERPYDRGIPIKSLRPSVSDVPPEPSILDTIFEHGRGKAPLLGAGVTGGMVASDLIDPDAAEAGLIGGLKSSVGKGRKSVQDLVARVVDKILDSEDAVRALPREKGELEQATIDDLSDYFQTAVLSNPKNPIKAIKSFYVDEYTKAHLTEEEAAALSRWIRVVHPDIHERSLLPEIDESLKGWEKKVLGSVAAATSVGALLKPEEAQAMPLGSIRKIAQTALKPSSAESILKGKNLGEKVVSGVKKSSKEWRVVQFDDGTELPMTKDYLNSLMRNVGTQNYLKEFNRMKGFNQKQSMAARSLETRLDRPQPIDHELYRKEMQLHEDKVRDIAESVGADPALMIPKSVFVRWPANDINARLIKMPKDYAEILEKDGQVTIVR